jgi:hypothetical protein
MNDTINEWMAERTGTPIRAGVGVWFDRYMWERVHVWLGSRTFIRMFIYLLFCGDVNLGMSNVTALWGCQWQDGL